MKLTKKDKEILLNMGCTEKDFPQIEEVMLVRNTQYTLDDTPITRKQAISLLGRRAYLAGISRSAFHWSSAQLTDDGREVGFDSTHFFKN